MYGDVRKKPNLLSDEIRKSAQVRNSYYQIISFLIFHEFSALCELPWAENMKLLRRSKIRHGVRPLKIVSFSQSAHAHS